jgi:hypothetical protein
MPISRHTGGGKYALLVANTTYMQAAPERVFAVFLQSA